MAGEQVGLRDEPDRFVGERFCLVDPVLPGEDLRAHSSPDHLRPRRPRPLSSLSLTEQNRSASP